ncbi:hypothetical protein GIB67_013083 [Kingdonia uniflora]|uniref:U-box domain-containing protein n=1 Tax=Kingdonia uniflora TaxID=39325 RepID=A0A7J7LXG9_9MAGN|nr:hypothetical protein GIB67_013083 [Kingdonia uniflora]
MTKYHKNNIGSLVLNRNNGGNTRLWSAFSGTTFRRKLLDAMLCGIPRHPFEGDSDIEPPQEKPKPELGLKKRNGGSERLGELLSYPETLENVVEEETENEVAEKAKSKIELFEEFQEVVKRLQFQEGLKKVEAASDVRRLAKEDSEARETMAMLGAIPPLIGMLDGDDPEFQIASLYALLNLGIGNDMNKGAIVTAGAIHKMLKLIESSNQSVLEAIVANFLALSALDSNKLIIGSSGAIPLLVRVLRNVDDRTSNQAKQDSLRAIYNLSISPANMTQILEDDFVTFLMSSLGDMDISERVLSILSNVVSTGEGRKSISETVDAFPILVDVLNWTDSSSCQEKSAYILMVMAHKAYGDRQAMVEAGIVSALLELTLLGSTLAQKRASRILECLRVVGKGKQVSENYAGLGGAISAPIIGSNRDLQQQGLEEDEQDEDMMSDEKKAVKQLVQQSLQNNMKRIVKRANLPQDFVPSDHFKCLTTTSTSKSLPF